MAFLAWRMCVVYLHVQVIFLIDLSVTQHTWHAEDRDLTRIETRLNSLPHAAVAGDEDASGDRASTHTDTYTNKQLAANASKHVVMHVMRQHNVNQASASRTAEKVSN